jgi:hypothetical protein
MRVRFLAMGCIFAAALMGCTPASSPPPSQPLNEEIEQAWNRLKVAIKTKSGDQVWDLVDKDTQADADRQAKATKEAFAKLADKDKGGYEKKLALSAKELADMTGKLYLQSGPFHAKHHEIADSKIEKTTVTGETATLIFVEPDNDKVTVRLTREGGKWKFQLDVPKAPE